MIELAVEMLQTDAVRQKIAEFKATSNRDPRLVFWMSYLHMVSTLLMFTRAETDGIWNLYLYAFRCKFPWFFRYDHLPANKEDLAFFLATELIRQAPEEKVVVTGGGFISEDQADGNDKSLNLDNLKATHEEADMRMIFHMLH